MLQQGKTTWRNFLGSCTASEGTREGAVTCLGDPYRAALPPRAASSWLGHPSSSWCSHQRRPPPSRHAATFPHPEAPRTLATSLREAALLGQETQKHGKKKKIFTLRALFAFPLPRALPAAAHPAGSPSLLPGYMEKKKKTYREKQQQQGEPARKQHDGRSRRKASSALQPHEAGEEGRISLPVVRDEQRHVRAPPALCVQPHPPPPQTSPVEIFPPTPVEC